IRGYVSSDVVKRQKASTKCRCLRHMSNHVSGRLTDRIVKFRLQVRNLPSLKHFRATPPGRNFGTSDASTGWETFTYCDLQGRGTVSADSNTEEVTSCDELRL